MPGHPVTRQLNDECVRELLTVRRPLRVRFLVQSPKRSGAAITYSGVPGHSALAEVSTLREFRRLWRAVDTVIRQGKWRDQHQRRTPRAVDLPAAGVPPAPTS